MKVQQNLCTLVTTVMPRRRYIRKEQVRILDEYWIRETGAARATRKQAGAERLALKTCESFWDIAGLWGKAFCLEVRGGVEPVSKSFSRRKII